MGAGYDEKLRPMLPGQLRESDEEEEEEQDDDDDDDDDDYFE